MDAKATDHKWQLCNMHCAQGFTGEHLDTLIFMVYSGTQLWKQGQTWSTFALERVDGPQLLALKMHPF